MRAQVTVFIIIGLVLIMGIGAYFAIQNRQHAEELQIQGQINSLELLPVQEYINKAAEDLLVEGIFIIGRQGGRIYDSTWPECQEEDPAYEETDRECLQMGPYSYAPRTYLDSAPYDHRRVAVLIDDGRDGDDDQWTMTVKTDSGSYFPMPQEQAYLHYQSAVGTTYAYGFFEPMPPISGERSVEQQLERWIENHLGAALNYTVLQESGYDIGPLSDVRASVDVNLEDVTANISYTVTIDREDIRYEPQHTFIRVDYAFRRFYKFIHDLVEKDITSRDDITDFTMVDDNGYTLSEIEHIESADSTGPNYEYDIIKVTDWSYDWSFNHGYEEPYLEFYFMRENRAPDAQYLGYGPEMYFYDAGTLTWGCHNDQVGGGVMDPDEDDRYTDEFPFIDNDPKWYVWWSVGEHLAFTPATTDPDGDGMCGDVPMQNVVVDPVAIYPELTGVEAVSFFTDLEECGNLEEYVEVSADASDVGDWVVVTVGDSMDFPIGYEDKAIYQSGVGTGRLNDRRDFIDGDVPVKCDDDAVDGSGCCLTYRWNVGAACSGTGGGTEQVCATCELVPGDPWCLPNGGYDISDCAPPSAGCGPYCDYRSGQDQEECTEFATSTYVCDHRGECVLDNGNFG